MFEPLSRIPGGMRYYFGAEARLRRYVEDTIMSVFDGWSYEEITTPSVDYYALFERGMGKAEAHRAFRFTDTDGRLLALRPDVTSSVARAAATLFADRPRPLRLCYAASVYRQQLGSHAEWRRESTHLGCEHIGPGERRADMEMLAIVSEVMTRLGLEGSHRITLSSVEFFNGIAEHLSLDWSAREHMRQLIDLKDAAQLEQFLESFVTSAKERAVLGRLARLSSGREILEEAQTVVRNNRSAAALHELEEIWSVIESLSLTNCFEIALGDVSGLDYYTGLVFKVYVSGAGTRVGRGGRYDHLTENFGRQEPAVGFVLDLDALTDVLVRGRSNLLQNAQVEATPVDGKGEKELFLAAVERRKKGERVEL